MTTDITTPSQQYVQFGGEGSVHGVDTEGIVRTIQEIERQAKTKVDLVVAADACKAVRWLSSPEEDGNSRYELRIEVPIPEATWLGNSSYLMEVNAYAHAQLASILGITKPYYDRMLASGDAATIELLVTNINHWLQRHGKRFMVRTLDNHIRAFMSDKYKPRDNFDLLNACLQPILESGAQITRLDLTESRFYARVLHNDWRERIERQNLDVQARGQVYQSWMADLKANAEGVIPYFSRLEPRTPSPMSTPINPWGDGGAVNLAPGAGDQPPSFPPSRQGDEFGLTSTWDDDWIIPGAVIQNSEIGQGMTSISPFALRQICMNGTVMDAVIAVRHLGSNANVLDGFLSQETISKENELVYAQVTDLLKATFDPAKFREMVERMNSAASEIIEKPVEAVDRTIGQFKIDEKHRQELLNYLIAGADPTRWGLINAVTAMAKAQESFDDRMQLESVGGKMLELVRVR